MIGTPLYKLVLVFRLGICIPWQPEKKEEEDSHYFDDVTANNHQVSCTAAETSRTLRRPPLSPSVFHLLSLQSHSNSLQVHIIISRFFSLLSFPPDLLSFSCYVTISYTYLQLTTSCVYLPSPLSICIQMFETSCQHQLLLPSWVSIVNRCYFDCSTALWQFRLNYLPSKVLCQLQSLHRICVTFLMEELLKHLPSMKQFQLVVSLDHWRLVFKNKFQKQANRWIKPQTWKGLSVQVFTSHLLKPNPFIKFDLLQILIHLASSYNFPSVDNPSLCDFIIWIGSHSHFWCSIFLPEALKLQWEWDRMCFLQRVEERRGRKAAESQCNCLVPLPPILSQTNLPSNFFLRLTHSISTLPPIQFF